MSHPLPAATRHSVGDVQNESTASAVCTFLQKRYKTYSFHYLADGGKWIVFVRPVGDAEWDAEQELYLTGMVEAFVAGRASLVS